MELMNGVDLSLVNAEKAPLRTQVAVRIIVQAAQGIMAAHRQSIVHRDIKPANLFLQTDEKTGEITVKVCDFGVAKRMQMAAMEESSFHLTRTGRMLGSPMYMSPEQARSAKHVDERTDVFSLSIVLWETLSGDRLWGGFTSLADLVLAICSQPIRQLHEVAPWVPEPLSRIVHRGLERDPARRWPSMQAMIEALEPFSGGGWSVNERDLIRLEENTQTTSPERPSLPQPSGGGAYQVRQQPISLAPSAKKSSPTALVLVLLLVALVLAVGGATAVLLR
jgi:serine/threonine-protein kinase